MTKPIYLDHQATTPLDERVLEQMLPYLTHEYGNPSSSHARGRAASQAVRVARRRVADLVGAKSDVEIVFTSILVALPRRMMEPSPNCLVIEETARSMFFWRASTTGSLAGAEDLAMGGGGVGWWWTCCFGK